jgi:DNA-binding MarR family transcriptional regulator
MYENVSDDLAFLISDAARLLRRAFDDRARTLNVTRSQWRVLGLLRRYDGSTQAQLAELLDVEPITVGRMIDRLQAADLVERRTDPSDRRAWRIHLTDTGCATIEQMLPLAKEMFQVAMRRLSQEQQKQLETSLNIIRDNLTPLQQQVVNG